MARSDYLSSEGRTQSRAIPHDVKKAVQFVREGVGRKVTMADLVAHCGVAERTLQKHFRAFMAVSPLEYWRRLRLAAAREQLLRGTNGTSITAVAACFGFNHFGRFSQQYRRCFGETPSATLRRSRNVALGQTGRIHGERTRDSGNVPVAARLVREKPTVAILPCQASATQPEHRFFGECLAEGIGTALTRARSLHVKVPKSSQSVRSFDLNRLRRELSAQYFVVGRIIQADKRIRLIVRLIEATGAQIWGDSYDGEAGDLLRIQDRVTEGVLRAILPAIRGAEIERARHKRPEDLDAYDLTLRALPFMSAANPSASRQALDLLNRALEIAPDYAFSTALAGLCHAALAALNGTSSPIEEKKRALVLAERAGILDPDDSQVLIARCAVHTIAGQFDVAGSLIGRALAIDPSSAWAWQRSGWVKTFSGEPETGLKHFRRAIHLDPLSPSHANRLVGLGCAHFDAGRYDQAAFWMLQALRERPSIAWVNRTLSVSYARLGERLAALDSLNALQHYCHDLTISQVMASLPFPRDFMERVAEGLDDLGLRP
jgi:TolB-like protein/AraC-like DNA-binding protein